MVNERSVMEAGNLELLEEIERRLRWLSSWMIHNANNLREKCDGLKVGGHQASCASMTAIRTEESPMHLHIVPAIPDIRTM